MKLLILLAFCGIVLESSQARGEDERSSFRSLLSTYRRVQGSNVEASSDGEEVRIIAPPERGRLPYVRLSESSQESGTVKSSSFDLPVRTHRPMKDPDAAASIDGEVTRIIAPPERAGLPSVHLSFLPPPDPECNYPASSRRCNAGTPRFYFNSETNSCEQFARGECAVNENDFYTFAECKYRCKRVLGVLPCA